MNVVKGDAALGWKGGGHKGHFESQGLYEGIQFSAYVASQAGVNFLVNEVRV